MNTQRLMRTPKSQTRPAALKRSGTTAGWMLLCTALGFCGVAWLIIQWGSSAAQPTEVPSQTTLVLQDSSLVPPPPLVEEVATLDNTSTPYNPDLLGTLIEVLETQGDGILLVGGSVLGGIVLLLVTARFMTRIPQDPLATGLGRTLTLLETDYRAGNLTPARALELARQAVGEQEREHDAAIAARTRAYDEAVAQLTKAHTETVAAIRAEATQSVRQAQTEASQANAREATALQRVANTEAQVTQLSRDLASTHTHLTEASTTVQSQAAEIVLLNEAVEEATETLLQWQSAHRDLSVQHQDLQTAHTDLKIRLTDAETIASNATTRAKNAESEAQVLRAESQQLQGQQQSLKVELAGANTEISRLRGVSLRELPITIPDREGDLSPHMAAIVEFIRGTTMDTGAAGGERTTKPVLSSWRDIRRLFQVLKGVGVRFAIAAHHTPVWVEAPLEGASDDLGGAVVLPLTVTSEAPPAEPKAHPVAA